MSLVRTVALVLGVAYVITGVAGFVPNFVTGGPPPDMPSADGSLFGIFPINAIHNVVHLAIGAALLYGSTRTSNAIMASRAVGIIYLIVGLLGFVSPDSFGIMPIGGADIALHLGTAAILLYLGFAAPEAATREDGRGRTADVR